MRNALTVSELNKYIKDLFSNDIVLSGLWVKGEISNFKNHYSGHLYFTIKDDKSLLKCVMFKSNAANLKFVPEDGMKVIISGYMSVFERDGQYQLYAEEIQPDGLGSLHIAFEQLKKKLQQEGLFDESRKRKLPVLPDTIGVITSSKGAVVRDIINILSRRFYNIKLKIYPVQVQGAQAASQIAAAIRRLNELSCVDVIILARGGGSLEELWAFNEEVVARSIFTSRIPIISAIGHETDFTISDFVADVRASTPSAAAEIVMPEKTAIKRRIEILDMQLKRALCKKIEMDKLILKRLMGSTAFKQPYNKVFQERLRLDVLNKYMQKAMDAEIKDFGNELSVLAARLDALSPLKALSRGYGIVKSKVENNLIKTIESVKPGDRLEISLKDGSLDAICERIEIRGEK
jgi:exodeoxyribonuclease VII, large subunit